MMDQTSNEEEQTYSGRNAMDNESNNPSSLQLQLELEQIKLQQKERNCGLNYFWVKLLAPQLTGKAGEAYANMALADLGDYDRLKRAIVEKNTS